MAVNPEKHRHEIQEAWNSSTGLYQEGQQAIASFKDASATSLSRREIVRKRREAMGDRQKRKKLTVVFPWPIASYLLPV
jgi:hypothetical protein